MQGVVYIGKPVVADKRVKGLQKINVRVRGRGAMWHINTRTSSSTNPLT